MSKSWQSPLTNTWVCSSSHDTPKCPEIKMNIWKGRVCAFKMGNFPRYSACHHPGDQEKNKDYLVARFKTHDSWRWLMILDSWMCNQITKQNKLINNTFNYFWWFVKKYWKERRKKKTPSQMFSLEFIIVLTNPLVSAFCYDNFIVVNGNTWLLYWVMLWIIYKNA